MARSDGVAESRHSASLGREAEVSVYLPLHFHHTFSTLPFFSCLHLSLSLPPLILSFTHKVFLNSLNSFRSSDEYVVYYPSASVRPKNALH